MDVLFRKISFRWLRFMATAFVLLAFLAGPALAEVSRELQLKAVFLYNFSQYTEWPASAFSGPQAPLVVGTLGKDPFGENLDEAIRGERMNQRPLVVQRFRRVEDVKDCQILFISASETKRLPAILAKLQGRNILTVSDMDDFTERGGMVRLKTMNNHIQLQINLDAMKAANVTMSSKLLRSAEIVSTARN